MSYSISPIYDIQHKSKLYSDQTGGFPVRSAAGKIYICVLYHYTKNSIHAVPIKSYHADHIIQAWEQIFNVLKHHGEAPELHILDYECLSHMIHSFKSSGVIYQLALPHFHRKNAAERAIRTLKNRLIAGPCTCNPKQLFLMGLPTGTRHNHPQTFTFRKNKSITVSLCCSLWTVQF